MCNVFRNWASTGAGCIQDLFISTIEKSEPAFAMIYIFLVPEKILPQMAPTPSLKKIIELIFNELIGGLSP
jgi:hypothetical protein